MSKDTSSGLYINYDSYEPWDTKIAWIRAFYDRVHKICTNISLFQKQVAHIKKVMSWNGYPYYVRNKIIKYLENRELTKSNNTLEQQQQHSHDFWQNTLCRSTRRNTD